VQPQFRGHDLTLQFLLTPLITDIHCVCDRTISGLSQLGVYSFLTAFSRLRQPGLTIFLQRLHELGWDEGQNFITERLWARVTSNACLLS
jgi:hypothetical protein